MKNFFKAALLFLSLAVLPARSQTLTGPIFFKITGNGLEKPSYLLGTNHDAPAALLNQIRSFQAAWEEVEFYGMELNYAQSNSEMESFMKYSGMPAGVTYRDLLSDEDYDFLASQVMELSGRTLAQVENRKPNVLKNELAGYIYMRDYPAPAPQDGPTMEEALYWDAVRRCRILAGLETAEEEHIMLYCTDPVKTQAEKLVCFLRNPHPEIESSYASEEAFFAGDLDKIHYYTKGDHLPCPMTPEFFNALIVERNEKWLAKITDWSHKFPVLYSAGIAHLAGPVGLINRLREMGYTVTPLD